MNMLYYCNYMIMYKIYSGMDYLLFSIFDNRCTRKFCKSDGYWKYVDNTKRMYNRVRWSKHKNFSVRILSSADTCMIFFISIVWFAILNMTEAIMNRMNLSVYGLFTDSEGLILIALIAYVLLIYFTHNVFIDRNDKYISYFKKFSKQKFRKLFVWYVLSYGVAIACCYFSLKFIVHI